MLKKVRAGSSKGDKRLVYLAVEERMGKEWKMLAEILTFIVVTS